MGDHAAALRAIPSVSALLDDRELVELQERWGHEVVVQAARLAIERVRQQLLAGETVAIDDWPEQVRLSLAQLVAHSLLPVINATGVVIHTNLGRAPLAAEALENVAAVARGYSNLEYDMAAGGRGSRHVHAEEVLQALTGAEAALVVNNNAAAVLLMLTALAQGREVIISRGQLIEIGGGFRIPEVMAQSGARLIEVGTTNRTYVSDYTGAISEATLAFLAVHRSNFTIAGFVHEPSLAELAEAAHAHGLLLLADLGSGTLRDTASFGLAHEITVQECLQAGADLVCFSGDKALGGPQAGIIAGRAALIGQLRRHPLMRALRVGKLTLAALEATLLQYRLGRERQSLPVWRMLATAPAELKERAEAWQAALGQGEVRPSLSAIGGGSLPGQTLPTWVLALASQSPQSLLARLRAGQPPVVARVDEGAVLLDPRTVLPGQDEALLAVVREALAGDHGAGQAASALSEEG